jgi:hypothetical protein
MLLLKVIWPILFCFNVFKLNYHFEFWQSLLPWTFVRKIWNNLKPSSTQSGNSSQSIQSFISTPTICLCAFLNLISSCLVSFWHGLNFGHEPKIKVVTCDVFYTQTWRMSHNVWHACKKKCWNFNWSRIDLHNKLKKESWYTWYFKNATFNEIDSIGIKWLGLVLPPLSNSKWSTTYCNSYWYITCYTTCYNSW